MSNEIVTRNMIPTCLKPILLNRYSQGNPAISNIGKTVDRRTFNKPVIITDGILENSKNSKNSSMKFHILIK
jgi:hypothetical protein